MPTTPDENDYSAWIGRSETLADVASRSAVIGLGAVLDQPLDPETADSARLFPLGHWLQFTPTAPMSELGADGHPKLGGFMPPLDLPRRMWAGSRIDFHAPITVGQRLERTSTIESITPKNGASGRLCFVVVRHDVSADGTLALTDRHTIVYREAVEVDP
ncbi:MAG: MaoC family dehydratase N-terminal domain-containing protein, partial [Solirubrobacteraceae bacterium]